MKSSFLHLPGFFDEVELFDDYLLELKRLTNRLLELNGFDLDKSYLELELGDLVKRLYEINPAECRVLYNLGSFPSKLLSANRLRCYLEPFVKEFLETDFIGVPSMADCLHLFLPDKELMKNSYIPIHQDFPYLLQSPKQATAWIPLTPKVSNGGGCLIWPDSNEHGVVDHFEKEPGFYETTADLETYSSMELDWKVGDLFLIDSLCHHMTIRNQNPDHVRILQLFRFSDLDDSFAEEIRWKSTDYHGPNVNWLDVRQKFL